MLPLLLLGVLLGGTGVAAAAANRKSSRDEDSSDEGCDADGELEENDSSYSYLDTVAKGAFQYKPLKLPLLGTKIENLEPTHFGLEQSHKYTLDLPKMPEFGLIKKSTPKRDLLIELGIKPESVLGEGSLKNHLYKNANPSWSGETRSTLEEFGITPESALGEGSYKSYLFAKANQWHQPPTLKSLIHERLFSKDSPFET